ncbi:cytidylyltransferase domain-containing protein [Planctobacterium marinum]|uniref:N-Acetylneuraminate cytidylyltransferase n=1 Tax=Planctobacterium marinum TaxID=1631968 RepID=A0AA48HXL6_9ALTE|nr:hypothetical protein MACH26_32740 [Planctobacterium marinum]
MLQNLSVLAFIGARAGSKGLPGKNSRNLGGKPLVAWTIEAALGSEIITDTLVSTDSDEVIEIAKTLGVMAPFKRPESLAGDSAAIEDAISHGLNWLYENEGKNYDLVVMLQPTSPFRNCKQIDEAIRFYLNQRQSDLDTLVSVVKAPQKSAWLLSSNDDGKVSFCFPQPLKGHRRQKLPQFYYPNGAIYIGKAMLEPRGFYTENTWFFEMSEEDSIDIDSLSDLEAAEVLMKRRLNT